ncbi:putative RNA-dependent RNA polymerase [Rhizoctonia fumigata mycovirus]|uniref:putative RNA-dependent RNA polymerase n=1 Tax=Rhizoctonia fumigata mycovirus TaxID=1592828 RepID=UPI0006209910|nr:putative RNA-dependent RNA polymerase [Rhizoctonia fumigata mycovirus]AKD01578.1 putative RNA-dependent RNA polymerase [Rhizoctonia fumigata mycovirus]
MDHARDFDVISSNATNPLKRSREEADLGTAGEAPWRTPVNGATINGVFRIRKFDVDYLNGPVADAEVVIAGLPRVKEVVPESCDALRGMKVLNDADHITTAVSSESLSGTGNGGTRRRNSRRSRKNKVKTTAKSGGSLDDLKEMFKHITVHDAQVRLGKFHDEITFTPADPAVLGYLQSPEGEIPGFDPSEYCFMEASGGVQMRHLKMYDEDTSLGPDFSLLEDPEAGRRALEHAIDHVQDLLRLPNKLPRVDRIPLEGIRYDKSKSCGAHYRLQGFKTRGDVWEVAMFEAKNALVKLWDGEYVEPRPTRMGGRGKLVKMSQERAVAEGVAKGRAIHMTDTRDHIILGLSEQPLNDAWKPDNFPISVGRGWFHGDATRFVRKHAGASRIYCFDAEKFDSSIMPWLIHIAVTIMREQFMEGLRHDADMYWQFVEESLLHSMVFRDDGVLFEKYHGTSSGHNHNSLAQSIVTCILASFNVFYKNRELPVAVIKANFTIEGLGDDNITCETDVLADETCEERGMRTWNVFGVSWLGEKSFQTNTLCQPVVDEAEWDEEGMFGSAQYLGKFFREDVLEVPSLGQVKVVTPYRPQVETVLRLLYPEGIMRGDAHGDFEEVFERARGERFAGHILDGSGNPRTRAWLDGYWQFCHDNLLVIELTGHHSLEKRLARLGVEIDVDDAVYDDGTAGWLRLVNRRRDGNWEFLQIV